MKDPKIIAGVAVLVILSLILFTKNCTHKAKTNTTNVVSAIQTEIKAGDENFRQHKYNSAIANYTKAIEINNKNAMAYFRRGQVKLAILDFEGAYQDIEKAYQLAPKNKYIARQYKQIKANPVLKNPEALKKAKEEGARRAAKRK